MSTTTKSDLINHIATNAGLTKTDAEKALAARTDAVTGALAGGDKVTLVGFGTFSVTNRAARTGRNPRTKAPLQIPASHTVRFKAGSALKGSVN